MAIIPGKPVTPGALDDLEARIPLSVVKGTATDRSSATTGTTYVADPELSGIALGVGTWWVKLLIFWTTPTTNTQRIKTTWTFSGSWNNPIRACIGPGATNTAARTDVATTQFNGVPAASDVSYGSAASTGFNCATEESFTVVVTVAGDLALSWAQFASSANVTSVKAGSAFMYRQIE